MKNSKPIFKRENVKGMACWYGCGRLAQGTFNFVNGDEIAVCFVCAKSRGSLKGTRNRKVLEKQAILTDSYKGLRGKNGSF